MRAALLLVVLCGCAPAEDRALERSRQAVVGPVWGEQSVGPPEITGRYGDESIIDSSFDATGAITLVMATTEGVGTLRVDAQGKPIDARVTIVPGIPRVASRGAGYARAGKEHLLAWVDLTDGGAYLSRFATGSAADAGVLLSAQPTNNSDLSLAVNDAGLALVAWSDSTGVLSNLHAVRVAPDDTVLDAVPISIASTAAGEHAPSVVTNGDGYLVAWEELGTPYRARAARVTPDGTVLDPDGGLLLGNAGRQPRAIFAAGDYWVFFADVADDGGSQIAGQRISAAGVPGTPFVVTSGAKPLGSPRPSFDGTQFWVSYEDNGRTTTYPAVCVARALLNGAALDPNGVEVSRSGLERSNGVMVTSPNLHVAVWQDSAWGFSGYDVRGAVLEGLTAQAQVGPPQLYSPGVAARTAPAAAAGAGGFVVGWFDLRNGPTDVYAARVSGDGRLLDDGGIRLGGAGTAGWNLRLAQLDGGAVALWNREDIAFTRDGGVYIRSLASIGAPSVRAEFKFASVNSSGFAVAGQGDLGLVVWADGSGPGTQDVFASRVLPDGTLLDSPPLKVCTVTGDQGFPEVAWDGEQYVVTWLDLRLATAATRQIFGARVKPDGTVLDPDGVRLLDLRSTKSQSIVAAGSARLLVWSEDRPDGGSRLAALELDAELRSDGGELELLVSAEPRSLQQLAWDGTNAIAHWGSSLVTVRLDGGSTLTTVSDRSTGQVAFLPDGRGLVTKMVYSAGEPASDVHFAMLGSAPNATACALPIDCRSGFCGYSGQCCATACGEGDCATGVCVLADGGVEAVDAGSGGDGGAGPRGLSVGCGCGAAPGAWGLALLAAALRPRRSKRVRDSGRLASACCRAATRD